MGEPEPYYQGTVRDESAEAEDPGEPLRGREDERPDGLYQWPLIDLYNFRPSCPLRKTECEYYVSGHMRSRA